MSTLVVGGTGVVGGATVRKLCERKQAVSVLLRGGDRHPKASALRELGATIIDGDLTDPESRARACRGAEVLICTATSMPTGADDGLRRVDREGTLALIDDAAAANVGRFVYVSYSGNLREQSPLETAKRDCERRLLASNMTSVILRPSYFMEVWLSPALGFDPRGGSVRLYGTGDAKVSYVAADNVAGFAAAAATHEYPDKKNVLEIGGPDAISQREAVRIFEAVFGTTITVQQVPLEALQAQRQSDDPVKQTFGALMVAYTKGDVIEGAGAVAKQHGVPLRSVKDYAASVATGAAAASHG
jgi:NADH dehydrogenase